MIRNNYHKPGYVSPSQRDTGMLAAHLSYQIVAARLFRRRLPKPPFDFIKKHRKPPSPDQP
jgi:hypothetical protein